MSVQAEKTTSIIVPYELAQQLQGVFPTFSPTALLNHLGLMVVDGMIAIAPLVVDEGDEGDNKSGKTTSIRLSHELVLKLQKCFPTFSPTALMNHLGLMAADGMVAIAPLVVEGASEPE